MEYFAGLDVSLRSCALCIVDSKGNPAYKHGLRSQEWIGMRKEINDFGRFARKLQGEDL